MLILKQIRKEKGFSIRKLSDLSGVQYRTIQDIEKRGDCMVSNLSLIAKVLNVSLDDLWIGCPPAACIMQAAFSTLSILCFPDNTGSQTSYTHLDTTLFCHRYR